MEKEALDERRYNKIIVVSHLLSNCFSASVTKQIRKEGEKSQSFP